MGSIPDEVIGFYNSTNLASRTMGPGVDSSSNRNEYQEYFWGVKGGKIDNLTAICEPTV
jgi:hypothetical protein